MSANIIVFISIEQEIILMIVIVNIIVIAIQNFVAQKLNASLLVQLKIIIWMVVLVNKMKIVAQSIV